MAISIIDKTTTHNTTASKNRTISYIVIHYTAGVTSKSGSAANTAAYFAGTTNQASADFIVDDANIVQYNPDIANRYCWHCGGNKYTTTKGGSLHGVAKNANSIGIEICSTNSTGTVKNANDASWSFTDAAVAKAVELTLYLMEKYGIDADHVIRHYDVTGKLCPGIIGWNADSGDESKWEAFKAKIGASASTDSGSDSSATTISVSSLPATPFTVKVLVSDLNYRSEGSMNGTVLGQTGKGTFTIVETSAGTGSTAGWGLLKSYQKNRNGWISLDFATKV